MVACFYSSIFWYEFESAIVLCSYKVDSSGLSTWKILDAFRPYPGQDFPEGMPTR